MGRELRLLRKVCINSTTDQSHPEWNNDKEIDGLEALANTIPTAATGSKASALQQAFIRSLILGTSPEGYISLCNVIAKASKPEYSNITVPLLILVGSEDKTAPLSGAEAILNAYGTSKDEKKIEILDGICHWHCVEAPEAVGQRVLDFNRFLF